VTRAHPNRDDARTRISSFCTAGACVGIAWNGDEVVVVDTKRPDGAGLRFTSEEWRAFVAGVKAGEFDQP
jgi:hypothetical protein